MAQRTGTPAGMTYTELEAAILYELGHYVYDGSSTTFAARYNRYPKWFLRVKINERMNELARETRMIKRYAIIPAVANKKNYRLPKNALDSSITAAYYYTSSTAYEVLEFKTVAELNDMDDGWRIAASSDPGYIYPSEVAGNIPMIGLYPPPDTTGTVYTGASDTGIGISTSVPLISRDIQSTATGGSASTVVDTAYATYYDNYSLVAGMMVYNVTDGCYGKILSYTNGTITFTANVTGGTLNNFTNGDTYIIVGGEYATLVNYDYETYVWPYRHGVLGHITIPANTLVVEYASYPNCAHWVAAADASIYGGALYPDIPAEYHKALVNGVIADILKTFTEQSREFQRAQYYEQQFVNDVLIAKSKFSRPYEEKETSVYPRVK